MNDSNANGLIQPIVRLAAIMVFGIATAACHTGTHSDAGKVAGILSASKSAAVDGVKLVASQYAMVSVAASFGLVPPTGVSIVAASWDFGDGSPAQEGAGPLEHRFFNEGLNTVTVTYTDSTGQQASITQPVTVIPYSEQLVCISGLLISSPQQGEKDQSVSMAVTVPSCLSALLANLQWNFGDGSAGASGARVDHIYTSMGMYNLSATLILNSPSLPKVELQGQITIVDGPAPQPQPGAPVACATPGATRQVTGNDYSETKKCGNGGTETDTYHDVSNQVCQLYGGEMLAWVETSKTKTLVNAGQCLGQSCSLPGGGSMKDGSSQTFYASQTPAAACGTVAQTRTCLNGTLSGNSSYTFLTCTDGCAGLGPNGTVQAGVVVGQITSPHVCPFGETGISDTYAQLADKTCSAGTVTTTNLRQGTRISAGVCPVYSWTPTDQFTQCSADCGGQQSQLYVCTSSTGESAPMERCQGEAPVITRVCDGNPGAASRTTSESGPDGDGSSEMCPAHQIGVIIKHRDKTTTTSYACVDHAVKVVDQNVSFGPWISDSYCRDYVGYRCSQDSLNNTNAHGRYHWMLKCADQVPAIKEFLKEFEDIKAADRTGKGSFGIGDNGRVLYPTFMYQKSECVGSGRRDCTTGDGDVPWIAPVNPRANCDVPKTVYVAAVCVSSCATPEQPILAQADARAKLSYQPIVESWQKKFEFVATLKSDSKMNSRQVRKTKVDQWVTELMDTHHDIIEFHMRSGGVLRLTPNHPLLGDDGMIRSANEFKVGDSLVRLGGVSDPIASLAHVDYFGKVYNVFVQSADLRQNIVVTNGYLNGTAFYQNEGAKFLNQTVLRGRLLEGVFGK